MKLLIVTQAVDSDDPVLGFFVRWIGEFATRVQRIEVICLKEGRHTLPPNVRVHSLGKERGVVSPAAYALRFLSLAWRFRGEYDAVFVHMNEEYILLAGLLWRMLGKRTVLWRNHARGSWRTRLAVLLANRVCFTSPESFTARFKKARIMPAGIDTAFFSFSREGHRDPHTLCCIGRIAPVKRVEVMIEATRLACDAGIPISFTHYGDALARDAAYEQRIRVQADETEGSFRLSRGISQGEVPAVYRANAFCVNASPAGSLDKAVLEGMACGCIAIASNPALAEAIPPALRFIADDSRDLCRALCLAAALSENERAKIADAQRAYVEERHGLSQLAGALIGTLFQL